MGEFDCSIDLSPWSIRSMIVSGWGEYGYSAKTIELHNWG
jgi:hypothetical protein